MPPPATVAGPLAAPDTRAFVRGQVGYSAYGWSDEGESVGLQIGHAWPVGVEFSVGAEIAYSRGGPVVCVQGRCGEGVSAFSEVEFWAASLEVGTFTAGRDALLVPRTGFRVADDDLRETSGVMDGVYVAPGLRAGMRVRLF